MPAGEQVALEPALAGVLARGSPSPGRRGRGARRSGSVSAIQALSVTSKTRAEPVGGGLVRAEDPEVAVARVAPHHVAQEAAEHPGRLGRAVARLRHRRRRSRGSRAARRSRRSRPPLACGLAPMRRVARRRQLAQLGQRRAVGVEQLLGPVAAHPVLEQPPGARGRRGAPASGTWCERQVPSTGTPSTSFGPVQPFGVRSTIIGQRGRARAPPSARASRWIAAISSSTASSVAASGWCIGAGSSPSTR